MLTAEAVISRYGLVPHPEGGWYREIHRSGHALGLLPGYPGERVAATVIYYLLAEGDVSVFHQVRSEEFRVHLAGAPLELVILDAEPVSKVLSPLGGDGAPVLAVPREALQAARSLGEWTLAACLVAPGFEFADFTLPGRQELLQAFPRHGELIRRFTRR